MKIGFNGRTVVVTGADHGLGRSIAQAFADLGASTWICGIDAVKLAETAGGRIQHRVVDVGDRDAVQRFIGEVGSVDVLVNNAGGVAGQVNQPIENVTPAQWQAVINVNAVGTFNMCQAVAPGMKARKSGRIINISSGAGLRPSLTGIQAYTMAKHAVVGLTKQVALELGPYGITCNSVAPGFIRSNPTTERQWESYGADGQKRLVDSIYLRRLGTPSDIANAVIFFASDLAPWVSGQVLSVDGGRA
ncbi:MAG: SDR family oxidoreductase [Alphaproteobacteria bacterium]|nr:SDR family oxidoreductase [Alphaproteobacteria bacterium]